MPEFPEALRLSFEPAPSPDIRRVLGEAIDAFNARTVPQDVQRFALLLHEGERLSAGLIGVLAWQWLFVAALWVDDAWQGQGVGTALLARAEAHAAAAGCHSVWLDTFQARGFYAALGYREFGALEDYPPGQTRYFMRKRLDQNSPLR
ncbi:MAG TPA: GNAT family N-acetyltransferase [Acetobacteraceae bacterium]|jgi:GNAT superfamily N-acetyltransferase|nr:GNAT family N-acetyltransferase [Acetobacteraceae bacterium]